MDQFSKTAALWLGQYIVYISNITYMEENNADSGWSPCFLWKHNVQPANGPPLREVIARSDAWKTPVSALRHVSAPYWPEGFFECPGSVFGASGGLGGPQVLKQCQLSTVMDSLPI